MKEKNILAKFRDFWGTLTQGEQIDLWDVLTALRGQDSKDCSTMKHFVTARIRGELFRQPLGGYHSHPTHKGAERATFLQHGKISTQKLKKLFTALPLHWQEHVQGAIEVLLRLHPRRARDLNKFWDL